MPTKKETALSIEKAAALDLGAELNTAPEEIQVNEPIQQDATLTITVGGIINLGNYNNLKIDVALDAPLDSRIDSDELAELVEGATTTLEKGIGYALANLLRIPAHDAIWMESQASVEAFLARNSVAPVIKGNPFAMRCLRLVIDDYSDEQTSSDDIQF